MRTPSGSSARGNILSVPLYIVERSFADQLDLTGADVRLIEEVNSEEGTTWLFSFLSADRKRSYCLYEAPSPEEILAAAKRNNIPADAIVEVDRVTPSLVP
jgi:hypothetical protein